MPLGQPSITTPRALQLQALQQTVANIRERFAATDGVVAGLTTSQAQAVLQRAADLSGLNRTLDALIVRIAALEQAAEEEGGGSEGDSAIYQAGGTVSSGSPVWLSEDGIVSAVDPDDPLAAAGFTGIATQDGADGDLVEVRRRGVLEIPGAAFTAGRQLYAALGGVTHEPAGNALPVGVAVSATHMAVAGGTVALAATGVGELGADFLPVTYALAAAAIALAAQFDLDATPGPLDGDVLAFDADTGRYRPETRGAGVQPVVTGEVPPVFVYFENGSLLYSGV